MRQKSILRNGSTHLFLNGVRLVLTSCSALARTTIVEIDRVLASRVARQYQLLFSHCYYTQKKKPFFSGLYPERRMTSFLYICFIQLTSSGFAQTISLIASIRSGSISRASSALITLPLDLPLTIVL